jgi:hypothetical protein
LVILLALVLSGAAVFAAYLFYPSRVVPSRADLARIRSGMSAQEVEAAIGPAREIPSADVPKVVDRNSAGGKRIVPVVHGARVLKWEHTLLGRELYVGLDDDRVVSKWYWEPGR